MIDYTPTPWRRDKYGKILDKNGKTILVDGVAIPFCNPKDCTAEANAERIIKCVNEHDGLVEENRQLKEDCGKLSLMNVDLEQQVSDMQCEHSAMNISLDRYEKLEKFAKWCLSGRFDPWEVQARAKEILSE